MDCDVTVGGFAGSQVQLCYILQLWVGEQKSISFYFPQRYFFHLIAVDLQGRRGFHKK